MKSKILFIVCCILMSVVMSVRAQNVIKGSVVDQSTNEILPGASVTVKGSNQGTMTDAEGNFSLQVASSGVVLLATYVGYESQEIRWDGRANITIRLQPSASLMDDVVVVGYGTRKVVNLTGSVSTIANEDINWKQVGQTSMALQGVSPGVTITQSSGQPGNDAGTVRIRGIGTLGTAGQAPLVLVDGIEMGLNNIDPNDIENISVLKDAASSAIYGSRAANGVVLVTTKRAKAGKIAVNYNGYVGVQSPIDMPKLVGGLDHMLLMNEAKRNSGQAVTFSEQYIEEYRKNAPSDLYPDTDWQALTLTGSGLMTNNAVDVSGGNETIRSRASLAQLKQEGIIPNTGYDRLSLRINSDLKVSNKLSFRFDVRGNSSYVYEPAYTLNNIFFYMNGRVPANQEGILSNGLYGQGWLGDNPIAAANSSGMNKERTYAAVVNLQGDWKPVTGMNINVMYSPEISNGHNRLFRKIYNTYYGNGNFAYQNPSTTNSLTQSSSLTRNSHFRTLVTYARNWGKNYFDVLGGWEVIESFAESFSAKRENYLLQDYEVLNAGSEINQQTTGAGGSEYGLISYFGRLNYNFDDRYLLEANLRYDGSSRFAEGHKYGLFPSFSVGWRLTEEEFMKDQTLLDNLKVRASWGVLGNQSIGNYPFSSTVNLGQSYIFNEIFAPGAAITALGNSAISWETTEMLNFGVDASLFRKLSLTAEYYIRNTRDILLTLPVPATVGLDAPYQNAGKVKNKGWELGLAYADKAGQLGYSARLALSDVKNEIVSLEGTGPYISTRTIREVGRPIDAFYGYQTDGFFQTDEEAAKAPKQFGTLKAGDIRYVDQNNDGIINPDDRVVLGSSIPRYTYSLNLGFTFKGLDLNAFFQGVGKVNGYLDGPGVWAFDTGGTAYEHHKDRWTPENPNASYPRLTFNETNNYQVSDFWMINGAYLRLKNLALGYSLPKNITDKLSVKNLRVNLSGQNILTFDKYLSGFDVETPTGGVGRYPIVKVYSVGLNVNF